MPNLIHRGRVLLVNGPEHLVGAAIKSSLFTNWLKGLDPKFTILDIMIQSVDIANGDQGTQIISIKLNATVRDAVGNPVPGIVYLRGGSVGILLILKCFDKTYCWFAYAGLSIC